MPTRANVAKWYTGLVAMTTVVSAAACGSSQSAGPLQTLSSGGQPYLAMSSSDVVPKQSADAEAYVFNSAQDPVQITEVTAVVVPGEPAGHLVHVGVQSTGDSLAGGAGWPPPVPVKQAIGAELPHGQTGIVFGITGLVIGRNYAVAGIRVEYKYHGQLYSTVAWAGEAACVAASWRPESTSWKADTASCQAFTSKVNSILQKTANLSY